MSSGSLKSSDKDVIETQPRVHEDDDSQIIPETQESLECDGTQVSATESDGVPAGGQHVSNWPTPNLDDFSPSTRWLACCVTPTF